MKAENGSTHHKQARFTHYADARGNRRQHGQDDPQIRHETEKAADESQEIEIWNAKETEDHHAANAHEHANGEVAGDKALHHGGDASQRNVGGGAMLRAEELHGFGPGMLPPAQHEVCKERDENEREHHFRHRSNIVCDHALSALILDRYGHRFLGAFGVGKDLLRSFFQFAGLLANVREMGANSVRVFGQFMGKAYGAAIKE